MFVAIAVTLLGLLLSAFFSGSETGFYRVTRVRLATDAKSGGFIARSLHWLASRPSLVVATVLIGNNIANYVVSFGLVLISRSMLTSSQSLETLLPVLMTPLLFVYGELLPKYLYYQVPYRLLRLGAPFMISCTVVFAPISIFVLLLEYLRQWLTGDVSESSAATLERQELQRVLVEGQEAGVLLPIQRELSQNLFAFGIRPVRQFAKPLRALPVVAPTASAEEIIAASRRMGQPIVGVGSTNRLSHCHVVSDLLLAQQEKLAPQEICSVRASDPCIQVLSQLQSRHLPLAQISDDNRRVIGVVSRERLTALLLSPT